MNTVKVDFSHRLSAFGQHSEELSTGDIADTVGLMCEHAVAIIELVAMQFEQGGGRRLNDSVNESALLAAANEIRDIQAVILALHKPTQSQPQAD